MPPPFYGEKGYGDQMGYCQESCLGGGGVVSDPQGHARQIHGFYSGELQFRSVNVASSGNRKRQHGRKIADIFRSMLW